MNNMIIFSPSAKEDLKQIKDYISIELSSPKAAVNVISKILRSIKKLELFPLSGTKLENIVGYENEYRYILSGNYITIYKVINNTVHISAVFYSGRDYISILFK